MGKPEGAENESVEQLAFADRIILNKCDLLLTGQLKTEIRNGEDCVDVEATENENKRLKISTDLVNEAGGDDSPLRALEDRIRTNFSRVDPKQLLNISAFSLEKVLEKEPDFLQSDGTDHVHDESVSSVSWNFPGLELNVHKLQTWI